MKKIKIIAKSNIQSQQCELLQQENIFSATNLVSAKLTCAILARLHLQLWNTVFVILKTHIYVPSDSDKKPTSWRCIHKGSLARQLSAHRGTSMASATYS